MQLLEDQVAIVTGAAQGIGYGIAEALMSAGCKVVVSDRDASAASAAAERLNAMSSGRATALQLDVTSADSIRRAVEDSLNQFRNVHILVNNAGIHCESPARRSSTADFSRCFEVNLFGIWRMCEALAPHFEERRSGKIINIASIDGRRPWPVTPAYSASKAAVINLTQSLALSLGPSGINVNAVCPGGIMTSLARQFTDDPESMEIRLRSSRALNSTLHIEDVGWAVVFLASAWARNISGQSLNVDGGEILN